MLHSHFKKGDHQKWRVLTPQIKNLPSGLGISDLRRRLKSIGLEDDKDLAQAYDIYIITHDNDDDL